MLTREEWRELDLRRLKDSHAWPQNPLPVKRDAPERVGCVGRALAALGLRQPPSTATVGLLYDHDTAVYEHEPPNRLIHRYGSVEELARDGWRPD